MTKVPFFNRLPFFGTAGARGFRASTLLLVAVLCACSLPAAGNEPDPTGRDDLENEIIQLMRRDQRAEALPLCRAFNERFPGDPDMLYNQACLENTTGRREAAAATFARAVAAGFEDFDLARTDPDLTDLQEHPTLLEIYREFDESLDRTTAAGTLHLAWRVPTAELALSGQDGTLGEGGPGLTLTWTSAGLDIDLRASGPWARLADPEMLAPWNGGAGLIVTLGIPDGETAAQTTNHFVFAFGSERERPIGALYLPGQKRWQAIAELQPKIRVDAEENLELQTMVPWSAILPYDPVVDERLGFNAAVRVPGVQGDRPAALLDDPAAFRPGALYRRVLPLVFDLDSLTDDVLVGKVSGTISTAEPVTVELAAVSSRAGSGRLTLDFLGGPDQSLLPGGQASGGIELTAGLNAITRQADFSALATGAYVIKAELDFPSGAAYSWGSTILQLAPGWHEEYEGRIGSLAPQEQPTAAYHLDSIVRTLAHHHPRRSPGPIITTLNELGRMLDSADENGSILPDSGLFQMVYAGPEGDHRVCHLYLPAGWKIAKVLNPVVILTAAVNMTTPIADRAGQNYEQGRQKPTLKAGQDEGFPVYLVPRLAPPEAGRPEDLNAETTACLAWVTRTFGTGKVSVAAADLGAAAVLQTAAGQAGILKALTVYAGRDLEPWPQADRDFLRQRLADFPPQLPVTWNDFVTETRRGGQAPLILEVLQESGANIVAVEEVRGGVNFTQVADRTVLWAEGLR